MWFKNLKIYQFTENFALTDQQLNEQLATSKFTHCSKHQLSSYGWISPLNKISNSAANPESNNMQQMLVHTSADFVIFCSQEEQKLLPASVINDLLQEKVSEIESKEAYKVGKKQKDQLKEEIVIDLLPRAFSRYFQNFAYIDRINNLLIVNASSSNKAEQLTEFMRKTIGTLPIIPVTPSQPIAQQLTSWLKTNELPSQLTLGESCELKDPSEDGGIVRCTKHDLMSDEIKTHINAGKLVTKLALIWQDKIEFILQDDMAIKRIRLTDTLIDQMDDQSDFDAITCFDADFTLMALEFSQFIPALLTIFKQENN